MKPEDGGDGESLLLYLVNNLITDLINCLWIYFKIADQINTEFVLCKVFVD